MATILTCYYRPKPGGLCTRLFRAMEALLSRGHTVHYLSLAPFPIEHPRCFFHRFPWPPHRGDSLLFWTFFHCLAPLLLLGIALRHGVTHAFAFGPTYAFLMRPLIWTKQIIPTCFLRGDPILSHRLQGKARWIVFLDQWIEGAAIHGVKVVGVSSHLTKIVLKRHPERRPREIEVLPNDRPPFRRRSAELYEGPLRLAVAGILEPMKNHVLIFQALHGLQKKSWHLSVYGQGPEAMRLADMAKQLSLCDQISFMGWVPNDAMWPEVDLLLASSLHEGMPNAVLEAVAAGVPVLASDIPPHRDILPANQLLPLGHPFRWRQALAEVLDAPLEKLSAMAQHQLRTSAHLCFDWDDRMAALVAPPQLSLDPMNA